MNRTTNSSYTPATTTTTTISFRKSDITERVFVSFCFLFFLAGRFYASVFFLLVLTITLGVSPANQQYKNKIVIFFTQFSAFLMMGLHAFFDLVPFHVFRDSIEHVSLLSIAIFHMHKIFERQAATTIL